MSSGITQELIAIVALAVVAVIYLIFLRKGNGKVPAWIAVLGIVASGALVFVMGHSYMMASRPAWDSALQILSLFGGALGMGPATMAALNAWASSEAEASEPSKTDGLMAVVGTAVNAVTTVGFIAAMSAASSAFPQVGYYFDSTHPNAGMVDAAGLSPFAEGSMAIALVSIAAAVVALLFALLGKKQSKWLAWGVAAAVFAAIGAVALRVVFDQMGASVFLFF